MRDAVVVGVDGSAASRRALDWALEEARRRRCGVEVVTAFTSIPVTPDRLSRSGAERVLSAARSEMLPPGYDRPVSFQSVEGAPAEVLTHMSEHAALLVVGSHAVDGLLRSAMASVGDLVARMAHCPVVLVPGRAHLLPTHDEVVATSTGQVRQE